MPNIRFFSPETNLTFLFGSLTILLFVVYPISFSGLSNSAIQIFFLFVLISGSYAAVDRPRLFHVSLVMAVITIIARGASLVSPGLLSFVLAAGTSLVFLVYTAGVVLSRVMRAGHITIHRIKGAIAVYMLLGLIWALGYVVVEVLSPGSFDLAGEVLEGADRDSLFRPMVYLSFVTMTTLGYGDITPMSPVSRSLTTLQALVGQFYIAVLVARLVAMEIIQQRQEDS